MPPDCLPPASNSQPISDRHSTTPKTAPKTTSKARPKTSAKLTREASDEPRNNRGDQTAETLGFQDAEEAWFWFIAAYEARQSGAKIVAGVGSLPRPCEPLDILRVVDRLYRQRRLFLDHLRVLNFYGRRGSPPDPRRDQERKAYGIWHEALARIEPALQRKGIVP